MSNLTPKPGYYVYSLSDPRDNTAFYIGKGCGSRCFSHQKNVLRKGASKSAKDQKILSLLEAGLEVSVSFLHECLTEEEALDLEAMEIESYGIDNLTNIKSRGSVGGSGTPGIGLGREIVNTWLSLPDKRLNICSVEMKSITPAFMHDCMDSVLKSALKSGRAAYVVEGISKAIEERHTGRYSPIG